MWRQAVRHSSQIFTNSNMDAALSTSGPTVRRGIRCDRRSHFDATGHCVRFAGRTRPTSEYKSDFQS